MLFVKRLNRIEMKRNYKTNIELVTELMEESVTGPLMQGFIICAIEAYAKAQIDAPEWSERVMINQASWKKCAQECLDAINKRK